MKKGEEGCSFYRLEAPVASPSMSAAGARRRIKAAMDKQRAAHNSAENTVALSPAVCEFIRPHAVPLVIYKCMQLI